MNDVEVKIENLSEVQDMFNKINLDVKQQANIYYALNKKAGNKVIERLKQNAPVGDNNKKPQNKIENNTIMARSKDNPTGVLIGFKKRAWYVKLIEYGVSAARTVVGKGKTKKYKGANRGSLPAQPFIERSHDEAAPEVMKELSTNYLKNINDIVGKRAKAVDRKNKKG